MPTSRRSCAGTWRRWRGRCLPTLPGVPPPLRGRDREGGSRTSTQGSPHPNPLPTRGRGTATSIMFMASSGGLKSAELFQGRDAILSGPAGGVVGMAETARLAGFEQGDRLRHGRHVDRRVALRRRLRALVRDRGGGRAHARADAAHPHGGGGRRLDPVLRRHALSRRPAVGRRRSRPQVLPPRRAAHRHRRQRHGRQAARCHFPDDLRARPRSAARRGRRCAPRSRSWRAEIGDGRSAGGGGRRLHPHRRREHGQRHQEDLGAARLRRDRVRAQLLRLGRRPARLPDRRHARHGDGADPSAVGPAVGLRHRAGARSGPAASSRWRRR